MFTPIDPTALMIAANPHDLLRDLYVYMGYVAENQVKRHPRTNQIPKTDLARIAKLLGDPELVKLAQETGNVRWVDFLDKTAYQMNLINYNKEGVQRNRNEAPTYPENFITIKPRGWQQFQALSPIEQEKALLKSLAGASPNEFLEEDTLSRLKRISYHNISHLTQVSYPKVRETLLDILKRCIPGQWYSTASLIKYLKNTLPFFLLPQMLPTKDRWGEPLTRYKGIFEKHSFGPGAQIPENAPDAFERVEGRYVERFLEGLPLNLRYVEVAYDPEPEGETAGINKLRAFRITERFTRLMGNAPAAAAKVTIQPNLEILVESEFYPAAIVQQIASLGLETSRPTSKPGTYASSFQLQKAAVAEALVKNPQLNISVLLQQLSGRELPEALQTALAEWVSHSEQFVLYEGFCLLEADEIPATAGKYLAQEISPTLRLARNTPKLFHVLEDEGRVPQRIWHTGQQYAKTASPAGKARAAVVPEKTAKQVKVKKALVVRYQFPDAASFKAIQQALTGIGCPFQVEKTTRTVILPEKEQARLDEAAAKIKKDFVVVLE